jgi:hypothetical protein
MTRYLILFDSYGLVFVGRPLWREDGSLFCICCWPWPGSLSRVRVPWDSWPYFTVSDLRLPFSSPPTTRRVTVEVFDPASTRTRFTENTCHVIATQPVHWRAGSYRAMVSEWTYTNHVTWPLHGFCVPSLCMCKLSGQKENTAAVLLTACVLRALPSNWFICKNIVILWGGQGRMWSEAVAVWFEAYPGICLEGLNKTTRNLSHDKSSSGWDLNAISHIRSRSVTHPEGIFGPNYL